MRGRGLDLNAREVATLAPLAVMAVVIGLYPESVLGFLHMAVAQLVSLFPGSIDAVGRM